MRNLLLMRHPLPRGLLVSLHLLSQLCVLATVGLWTREALAPLATTPLGDQWPTLVLGGGAALIACLLVRLMFELLMTPHHVQAMLQRRELPFTRSTRRRPAVHDETDSWVGEARRVSPATDTAQGDAPATSPGDEAMTSGPAPAAAPSRPAPREPQLDLAATAWTGEHVPQGEPRL